MDSDGNPPPHHKAPPLKDVTAFDLLRALEEQSSCPVCHLTRQMVGKYLDWFAYESATDPQPRARLRGALGFCAPHGQLWMGQSDALATALIYDDVFTEVRKVLQSHLKAHKGDKNTSASSGSVVDRLRSIIGNGGPGSEAGEALAASLRPKEACPVCVYSLDAERRLAKSFAQALENANFMSAYAKHPVGLCLPHLRAVLPSISSEAILNSLVRTYQANLEKTSADLQEVIRKSDYRYSSEPRGAEFSAPGRSVEQAGGLLATQTNMGKVARSPRQ